MLVSRTAEMALGEPLRVFRERQIEKSLGMPLDTRMDSGPLGRQRLSRTNHMLPQWTKMASPWTAVRCILHSDCRSRD